MTCIVTRDDSLTIMWNLKIFIPFPSPANKNSVLPSNQSDLLRMLSKYFSFSSDANRHLILQ